MKIKTILMLAAMAAAMVGCKSSEPFDTQTEDDYPRILYPVNESGSDSFNRNLESPDEVLVDSCVASPSDYVTINWYLDGDLVHTGKRIEMSFPAGEYELKIEAVTTAGKSTYRTGKVTVSPFKNDPYSNGTELERSVKPGSQLVLTGSNLSQVKKVLFYPHVNATEASASVEGVTATSTKVTLTVPELEEGSYFLRLTNSDGLECGANRVMVYTRPVILSGYQFFTLDKECEMLGLNLDKVASVAIDGQSFAVASATDNAVAVAVTGIAEGMHTMVCKATDGSNVNIITKTGSTQEVEAMISSENLLFYGPVEIDWNQDLCRVTKKQFADVPLGSVIRIYYTVPAAEYHQYRILAGTTWTYNVPGGDQQDIKEDTPNPLEFPYDEEFKTAIDKRGSMCVVGFGFTVQYITWK